MTDGIRERFEQMFAPNPIPPEVFAAYEKAAFLMNKVDAPAFNIRDLCIIAGCAIAGSGQTVLPMAEPRQEVNTMAPIPINGPTTAAPPAAAPVGGRMDAPPVSTEKSRSTTMAQLSTLEDDELTAHATMLGLTIPDGLDQLGKVNFIMGNPYQRPQRTNKPVPTAQPKPKSKGKSESAMRKMSTADLRQHALAAYGFKAPKRYSRDTLAAVLQGMTPLD